MTYALCNWLCFALALFREFGRVNAEWAGSFVDNPIGFNARGLMRRFSKGSIIQITRAARGVEQSPTDQEVNAKGFDWEKIG